VTTSRSTKLDHGGRNGVDRSKAVRVVNERVQLQEVIEFAGKKYVPVHRHSVCTILAAWPSSVHCAGCDGHPSALYYKGGEELAFESIQYIMAKVRFGWLIRSVHSWAANLFILAAMVHMFSVYFERSYRKRVK